LFTGITLASFLAIRWCQLCEALMLPGRGESRGGQRGVHVTNVDLTTHLSLNCVRVGETSLCHLHKHSVAFFVGALETLLASLFEYSIHITMPPVPASGMMTRRGFVELSLPDIQIALRFGPLATLLLHANLREAANAFLDANSRAAVERTVAEPPQTSAARPTSSARPRSAAARPRSAAAASHVPLLPPPPLGPPNIDDGVALRGGAAGAAWAPGRDDAVARAHVRHLLRRINPAFTLSGSAAAFLAAFAREWFEVIASAADAAGLASMVDEGLDERDMPPPPPTTALVHVLKSAAPARLVERATAAGELAAHISGGTVTLPAVIAVRFQLLDGPRLADVDPHLATLSRTDKLDGPVRMAARAAGCDADDLVVVFRGEEVPPGLRGSDLAVIKTASLFLVRREWWDDAWALAHEHSEAVRAERTARMGGGVAPLPTTATTSTVIQQHHHQLPPPLVTSIAPALLQAFALHPPPTQAHSYDPSHRRPVQPTPHLALSTISHNLHPPSHGSAATAAAAIGGGGGGGSGRAAVALLRAHTPVAAAVALLPEPVSHLLVRSPPGNRPLLLAVGFCMDSIEVGTLLLAQVAGEASSGMTVDIASLREAADAITRAGMQLGEAVDVAEMHQKMMVNVMPVAQGAARRQPQQQPQLNLVRGGKVR
jgi:hypothetical protein